MAPVALITGATGIIGRHVIADWDVSGLEPLPISSSHDLLRPGAATDLIRTIRPDVVLHLAWTASSTPGYRHDPRNAAWVTATIELAAACAEIRAWLVATGTAVDDRLNAMDAYTTGKARLRRELADDIALGRCSWLRPYYVVDPIAGRPTIVAEALEARAEGRPLVLRTPSSEHDFVHVADVAEAARTVVRLRLPGEVPIGSGTTRPVTALVEALGASWKPITDTALLTATGGSDPTQHHESADVRRLRDHGWMPFRTKEMFQID